MKHLTDEEQLVKNVVGVARALDERNWNDLKNYFDDEFFLDISSAGGPKGNILIKDMVLKWKDQMSKFRFTLHSMTNFDTNIQHGKATVNSYSHAIHGLPEGGLWIVYAIYNYEFKKIEDGWKISSMKFNLQHQSNKN